MKICDVEYQGDKTKATFYYTAPDRVDFRELIKIYGENFEVRVDMRQIGARQEASKIGGLGICGRELCCSTWLSSFESITTNKARNQQIALNTEKLTGLCCKLKCCFNYENQWYVQALKEFPNSNIILKTKKGDFKCNKTDVIKRTMSYFPLREKTNEMLVISIENIKKIIEMNSKGIIPEDIDEFVMIKEKPIDYGADITMEDLTKFEDRDDNDQVR